MAVLTCAEMVSQCLERQPTAWKHFFANFLPFASAVLERHFPALEPRRAGLLRDLARRAAAQSAQFFRDYSGSSEREFLRHLRDLTLRLAEEQAPPTPAPEIPLDWEVFEKAFAAFNPLERQIVWMFVLAPRTGDADQILRLDPRAAASYLAKAQEALRAACDRWNPEMLAQNAPLLVQTARQHATPDCEPPKVFLRYLDGQITWRDRADLEHHLALCWPCIDLLCSFREILFLTRQVRPLPDPEAAAYLQLVGMETPRPSPWKRLLGKN